MICFDLGGVLVRICRSWPEGCREAGIPNRAHQPGPDHDVRKTAKVHHAWIIEPYAGTAALISEIQAAGIRTACLSNTSHSHWGPLLEDPAIASLDVHHASHLLGLHKPEAAIYRAFEDAVGLSGKEIVFFDDLKDNITAARAADWDAIQIDHASETAPQIRSALEQRGVL